MSAPIKRWSPKHELVVHLSISTMGVEEIAEVTGYTPARILQIRADPQAILIQEAVIARMRAKMMEDIENGLVILADHAVKRIAETITFTDFVPGSDAKKHQDNLSLGLLKGVGLLGSNGQNGAKGDTPESPLNEALSNRIVTALEESNKAAKIRQEERNIVIETKHELIESSTDKEK